MSPIAKRARAAGDRTPDRTSSPSVVSLANMTANMTNNGVPSGDLPFRFTPPDARHSPKMRYFRIIDGVQRQISFEDFKYLGLYDRIVFRL